MTEICDIMIVDDDQADIALLSRAFTRADASTKIVSTTKAEETSDMALRLSPQMICIDFRMPKLDGAALIKALRSDARFDQTLLLLLSSSDHPKDVQLGYKNRANAYYVKPGTLEGYDQLAAQLLAHWGHCAVLPR